MSSNKEGTWCFFVTSIFSCDREFLTTENGYMNISLSLIFTNCTLESQRDRGSRFDLCIRIVFISKENRLCAMPRWFWSPFSPIQCSARLAVIAAKHTDLRNKIYLRSFIEYNTHIVGIQIKFRTILDAIHCMNGLDTEKSMKNEVCRRFRSKSITFWVGGLGWVSIEMGRICHAVR